MTRKYENFRSLVLLFLLFVVKVCPQNQDNYDADDRDACAYMQCENNDQCIHRKFWCRRPPCPSMLYCAKSRKESLRGPSTCDAVQCSTGYVCVLKVRRCRWDERCKQQIARCVPREEYYEGPASCAGFKCPAGNHCILRESLCISPPCKLLKSCARNKDIQVWFNKCRELGCPSEFECFLRRPDNSCPEPPCRHTPDCTTTTENEMTNENCRGWICPRLQKCFAEIPKACQADSCDIKRTCRQTATPTGNSAVYDSTFCSPKTFLHKGDEGFEPPENTTEVNDQHTVKKHLTQIKNEPVPRDKEKRGTEISSTAEELGKTEIMGDVSQTNSGTSVGRVRNGERSSGSTNVGSPLRVYPTSLTTPGSTSDKFDQKRIVKPWSINEQDRRGFQFQNVYSGYPSNFRRERIPPILLKTFLTDNYDNEKNVPSPVEQETQLYGQIDDGQIGRFRPKHEHEVRRPGAWVQSEQDDRHLKSRNYDTFRKSLPDAIKNSYSSRGNVPPHLLHKNFMNLPVPPNETTKSKILKHSSMYAHTSENTPVRDADKGYEVSLRNILSNPFFANYGRRNVENDSQTKMSRVPTYGDDHENAIRRLEELLAFYQNNARLLPTMIHLIELMNQRNQTQSPNPWIKQQLEVSGEDSKKEISTASGSNVGDVNVRSVDGSVINRSREINYIPFSDYFEINPLDGEIRTSPGIRHRVRNTSDVPYDPLPFKNVGGFLQEQLDYTSFNENNPEDTIDKPYTSTVPTLSFYNDFARNMENTRSKQNIPQRVLDQRHSFENGLKIDKHEKILIDKPQRRYFDDITDSPKGIIKSFQPPPAERTMHSFQTNLRDEHENRYDSTDAPSPNKQFAGDYDWRLLTQVREYERTTTQRNREKLTVEQPSLAGRKQLDFEVGTAPNVLFDGAAESEVPNQSMEHAQKYTAESNGDVDLLSFIEINKGNILAYIKALIEAINHDYDSAEYAETISHESVMRKSSANYMGNNLRQPIVISRQSEASNDEARDIFADAEYEVSENPRISARPAETHVTEKLEDTRVTLNQQENVPRTSDLIYGNERPAIRFFKRVPSYGTGEHRIDESEYADGDDRVGEDRTGHEDEANKFLVDYANYN